MLEASLILRLVCECDEIMMVDSMGTRLTNECCLYTSELVIENEVVAQLRGQSGRTITL